MFRAKVITGQFVRGDTSMQRPPKLPGRTNVPTSFSPISPSVLKSCCGCDSLFLRQFLLWPRHSRFMQFSIVFSQHVCRARLWTVRQHCQFHVWPDDFRRVRQSAMLPISPYQVRQKLNYMTLTIISAQLMDENVTRPEKLSCFLPCKELMSFMAMAESFVGFVNRFLLGKITKLTSHQAEFQRLFSRNESLRC